MNAKTVGASWPTRKLSMQASAAVMALLFLCRPTPAQHTATNVQRDQIQAVLDEYVRSIDTADVSLADQLFSHASDVLFISPGGIQHGVAKIEADFYQKAMAGGFSQRTLTLEHPLIAVYGDTAWSEFAFTFTGVVKSTGKTFTTTGVETQVYRREGGVWHIVLAHHSEPDSHS